MRGAILRFLMNNPHAYVSGQGMAGQLGISRAAIKKHVDRLKGYGCEIDCKRNAGYKLISMPDILLPEIVETYRFTDGPTPYTIFHHHVVDSTNQEAKVLAIKGVAEGAVVVAESQTAGRGRMGREWTSPPSQGIYTSIVLRPSIHPSQAYGLSVVAGIAVARALTAQGMENIGLKWPNDVQAGKRKLCGILTEMSATMDTIEYLVVGIGVNVNQEEFSPSLAQSATSVSLEMGRKVSRAQILAAILAEFFDLYQSVYVQRETSFSRLIREYNDFSVLLDQPIQVQISNVLLSGICVGFDTDGALLLEEEDGEIRTILAGNVSVRGSATYQTADVPLDGDLPEASSTEESSMEKTPAEESLGEKPEEEKESLE